MSIANEPLDTERVYRLATREYMARGNDGDTSLLARSEGREAEEVVSEENGMLINMILRQYFMSVKILGKWARWSPSLGRHWGGVHEGLHVDGRVKAVGKGRGGSISGGKGGGSVWRGGWWIRIRRMRGTIIISTGIGRSRVWRGSRRRGRGRLGLLGSL